MFVRLRRFADARHHLPRDVRCHLHVLRHGPDAPVLVRPRRVGRSDRRAIRGGHGRRRRARGDAVGGDPSCTAAGCDRQKLSLTFQSASLNATWDAGAGCEVTDTPRRCPRRVPRPVLAPLTRVTAKVTCENTLLPCTNAKVSATAWTSRQSRPAFTTLLPRRGRAPANPPRLPDPARASARPRRVRPREGQADARSAPSSSYSGCSSSPTPSSDTPTRISRARDDAPASWQWARRWAPFRCDEELAAGGGRGIRGECEHVVLVRAGVLEVQRSRPHARIGLSPAGAMSRGAGRGEANTSRLRVMHTIARAIKNLGAGIRTRGVVGGTKTSESGRRALASRAKPARPTRAPRLVPRGAVAFDRLSHHQKMHPKMIVVRLVFRSARPTYRLSARTKSSTFAP